MGFFDRVRARFRLGGASMPRAEEVKVWFARLEASQRVYGKVTEKHKRYEDALQGEFGRLTPPGAQYVSAGQTYVSDDQVPLNLFLRASSIYLGKSYDEFPSISVVDPQGIDQKTKDDTDRFLQAIVDDGDAVRAARRSMRSSFTRGVCAAFVHFGSYAPSAKRNLRTKIRAAEIVLAVKDGEPVELGEGLPWVEIAAGARQELSPTTPDGQLNPYRALLNEDQVGDLTELAQLCDAKIAEELERPAPPMGRRAAITFQSVTWGIDVFPDATATTLETCGHFFRRVTYRPEEFKAETLFTDKAKSHVEPRDLREMSPDSSANSPTATEEAATEEHARFVVWECHDLVHRRLYYIAEGYDDYLNSDFTYPYLNENGEELFRGLMPMEWATPLEYNGGDDAPERIGGLPLFDPGWAPQVETIKNRTAWAIACKSSGRVFRAAKGLPDTVLDQLRAGIDNVIVEPPENWDRSRDGELIELLQTGEPPKAYLDASLVSKTDFASMVSIGIAELSGEPIADTAAQENMALQGAGVTQNDYINTFQAWFAGLVAKAAAIVRMYFSDAMISAYGFDPAVIRAGLAAAANCKIRVRFASTTRAEDERRLNSILNYIAVIEKLRNPITGMPDIDPIPYAEQLAKEMDLPKPVRWVPKPEDVTALMALAQVRMLAAGGAGGPSEQGGGAEGVPGRKERKESEVGARNGAQRA